MIKINENGKVDARELYAFIEVKTRFSNWIKRSIDYADLIEEKDFYPVLDIGKKGGRPTQNYQLTIDAAKEVCLVSATAKGKDLRKWLIDLSVKRENLELITIKEAAFAVKVINCLKYIDNQKEAYSIHQKHFVGDNSDRKNIYSDFAQYRAKIVGWDKKSVDEAIDKYLNTHSGHNRKALDKSNMQIKLSVMDIGEAIRVAVLDILYSKETDSNLANRFSALCKNLANEMKVQAERENSETLFRNKEEVQAVDLIKIG